MGLHTEGIGVGDLMIHYTGRPLTGECPCPDARAAELCPHMAALAWTYLGDDTELTDRLAAMPPGELVALAVDLADRSAWGAPGNLVATCALTFLRRSNRSRCLSTILATSRTGGARAKPERMPCSREAGFPHRPPNSLANVQRHAR
ncbi:MAG: hypothetical protein ACRDS9_12835 [Pseudonocardiaceae bacterium]